MVQFGVSVSKHKLLEGMEVGVKWRVGSLLSRTNQSVRIRYRSRSFHTARQMWCVCRNKCH